MSGPREPGEPSPGQPSPVPSSQGQPLPGRPLPGRPSPGQPSPGQPWRDQPSPGERAEAATPGARAEPSTDRRAPQADPASDEPLAERPVRPDQTRDDTDVGWGETPEPPDAHDRWLLEQRPPHWD
jgi:hypothetical protein